MSAHRACSADREARIHTDTKTKAYLHTYKNRHNNNTVVAVCATETE